MVGRAEVLLDGERDGERKAGRVRHPSGGVDGPGRAHGRDAVRRAVEDEPLVDDRAPRIMRWNDG